MRAQAWPRSGEQLIAASIEEYESTLLDETDETIEDALMGYHAAAEIAIQRLTSFRQIRPRCSAADVLHAEYALIQ